jgi:hypothetical protein
MSAKRYFTVAEANAQVGQLASLFTSILQLRGQLKRLYESLDAAGFAPSPNEESMLPEDAPAEVARDRARFYGLVETLRELVESVHATGAQIKDIETGLVDWPARNANKDILLCWRFGEREVSFWHEPHTGYSGRRPVSELDDAVR